MIVTEAARAAEVPPPWHGIDAEAALAQLASGRQGITASEAQGRLQRDGPNLLPQAPPAGPLAMLARQFADFMIGVLIVAAIVAAIIGEPVEAAAILAIVVLNAVLGFAQEWRAEQAMAALRALSAPHAQVIRGGARADIPAAELVAGDIVWLEAGTRVPADLRLIDGAALRIDEAALTGESVPADKDAGALSAAAPLADRHNMAYCGTMVTAGRGIGLVVATGAGTELGHIARLVESAGEQRTPLQERLARFGRRLALLVLAICAVIFAAGLARGEPLALMFLTAISLAVAAIPEALPAVVSIALAFGAHRMSREHALVRRLPCVESLGSVTVICSDKTGTLTENRLRVDRLEPVDADRRVRALRVLALNSDASRAADARWVGDPTEIALVEAAAAAGIDVDAVRAGAPRIAELPFDSVSKRMCTLHAVPGGALLTVKGAPEAVLPRCIDVDVADWQRRAEELAGEGLRVLALAARPARADQPIDGLDQRLELLALVGLIDPPRAEAAAAVAECATAGIVPVMITGDHPDTALAIARSLCMVGRDAHAVTGSELARLDAAALRERVMRTQVYARVDPAQKIGIVEALQARGECVAMTGDGVNDAPALRRADIGVAMGRGGTDVAREASDLVLLDDNFATIVAAVREGRRIYDNIRKFVRFVMAGNAGEIWTIFLAPFLGLPIPLTPIQILWVNFVTDGLPGVALTGEPAEPDVMRRPPRPRSETVFARGVWQHILWAGLLIGGVSLYACHWAQANGAHAQTMTFTVLTFAQLAHVMAIRSERESLFTIGVAGNRLLLVAVLASVALHLLLVYVPWLQRVFGTEPLAAGALALACGLALLVFAGVELEKWAIRRGWLYRADLRAA